MLSKLPMLLCSEWIRTTVSNKGIHTISSLVLTLAPKLSRIFRAFIPQRLLTLVVVIFSMFLIFRISRMMLRNFNTLVKVPNNQRVVTTPPARQRMRENIWILPICDETFSNFPFQAFPLLSITSDSTAS